MIASTCGVRRSGAASNSSRRKRAASLLRSATATNRSKNSSSRGSRRTAGLREMWVRIAREHSGPRQEPLGYGARHQDREGGTTGMATAQQPQADFVKAISRLDATALVVGSMIGSGIFIVSAEILREVHAPGLLLIVWAVSGVVTLMGALTYGELAALFPGAGGQYVYLREGISPLFGYLYGWTLFVVIQTGTIAAVAVAFARFTAVFWPGLTPDVFLGTTVHFPQPIGDVAVGLSPQRIFAVASVAALTWINVRGVRTAAIIQTSLTAIKTAALAALILLGLSIGRHADALAANFGANFWATGGGKRDRRPRRDRRRDGGIALRHGCLEQCRVRGERAEGPSEGPAVRDGGGRPDRHAPLPARERRVPERAARGGDRGSPAGPGGHGRAAGDPRRPRG